MCGIDLIPDAASIFTVITSSVPIVTFAVSALNLPRCSYSLIAVRLSVPLVVTGDTHKARRRISSLLDFGSGSLATLAGRSFTIRRTQLGHGL